MQSLTVEPMPPHAYPLMQKTLDYSNIQRGAIYSLLIWFPLLCIHIAYQAHLAALIVAALATTVLPIATVWLGYKSKRARETILEMSQTSDGMFAMQNPAQVAMDSARSKGKRALVLACSAPIIAVSNTWVTEMTPPFFAGLVALCVLGIAVLMMLSKMTRAYEFALKINDKTIFKEHDGLAPEDENHDAG